MDDINKPGTEQHIPLLKQDVATIVLEMQYMRDDLKQTMRNFEAELLKAFHTFEALNRAKLNETEQ